MMNADLHILSAFEVSIQWCKKGQKTASLSPGLARTYGTAARRCEVVGLSTTLNGKQESEQEHVDYSCALFGLEWQLFGTSQFGWQCESIVRDLPKTREAWQTGTGFATLRLEAFKSKCHGPWIYKIWLVELDLRQRWQRLRFLDVTVDDCQVNGSEWHRRVSAIFDPSGRAIWQSKQELTRLTHTLSGLSFSHVSQKWKADGLASPELLNFKFCEVLRSNLGSQFSDIFGFGMAVGWVSGRLRSPEIQPFATFLRMRDTTFVFRMLLIRGRNPRWQRPMKEWITGNCSTGKKWQHDKRWLAGKLRNIPVPSISKFRTNSWLPLIHQLPVLDTTIAPRTTLLKASVEDLVFLSPARGITCSVDTGVLNLCKRGLK